ncbi:uncharacterized protein MEPE_00854 [Melanopsichium pennsylvanicum]|uniref:Uncharacterized protein n=2 Tax=Melanopsichium pennsylvanicum TaxID=63383 RepID=A0AAJ4XJA7_9BASI|nr:uncharacterized protein MEPE_00854 [Melanopsichium pennsylvanicum]
MTKLLALLLVLMPFLLVADGHQYIDNMPHQIRMVRHRRIESRSFMSWMTHISDKASDWMFGSVHNPANDESHIPKPAVGGVDVLPKMPYPYATGMIPRLASETLSGNGLVGGWMCIHIQPPGNAQASLTREGGASGGGSGAGGGAGLGAGGGAGLGAGAGAGLGAGGGAGLGAGGGAGLGAGGGAGLGAGGGAGLGAGAGAGLGAGGAGGGAGLGAGGGAGLGAGGGAGLGAGGGAGLGAGGGAGLGAGGGAGLGAGGGAGLGAGGGAGLGGGTGSPYLGYGGYYGSGGGAGGMNSGTGMGRGGGSSGYSGGNGLLSGSGSMGGGSGGNYMSGSGIGGGNGYSRSGFGTGSVGNGVGTGDFGAGGSQGGSIPPGYIRYQGQVMTIAQFQQALASGAPSGGSSSPYVRRRSLFSSDSSSLSTNTFLDKRQAPDSAPPALDSAPPADKKPAKIFMCINGDPDVPPIKFNTMTGLKIRDPEAQQDGVVEITNLPNYQMPWMPFLPTAEMWEEQQTLMLAQEEMIETNMTTTPPRSR